MQPRLAVTLQGMRFHARIGVLAHEIDVPQPVEIDLTVWRRRKGAPQMIDYRALYAMAERALSEGHIPYLEDVAERLVAAALALPGVAGARVAVRKPHVALPGPLGYAEVVLDRTPTDGPSAARPRAHAGTARRRTPRARASQVRKRGR
jgi:7,8-dihydroneopterin aldolase/epimerase/oxygenase